jgi:hypothetical protein
MNVLDMEADMVPSLARDHPHTYEPIASRRRAEPHRLTWRAKPDSAAEFGSLEPEPSRTRESDSYVYGHL